MATDIINEISKKRAYKGSDVNMLTATSTIVELAIAQKTFLISKRPIWADPFLPNIKTRINSAFSVHLGIDNALQMREATQTIYKLQADTLVLLAEFKIQVEEDFKNDKKRREEILTQLGFSSYHKQAQQGNQEALVNLLFQFTKNMSAKLKTEITTAGTAETIIDDIIAKTQTLKDSSITQETLKSSRPELTQESVKEFNEIFKQVMSIAKISAKFFKANKVLQSQFSYSKTLKAITSGKINPESPESTPDNK
ncbi:MAG: hypothetical protein A2046_11575 [Bacteroidetes bacterium GWA2_30_7]|nr:MAG: hypothetical protein A2046_11575 [Bacteroidetes bacterium GWA2_30_7]